MSGRVEEFQENYMAYLGNLQFRQIVKPWQHVEWTPELKEAMEAERAAIEKWKQEHNGAAPETTDFLVGEPHLSILKKAEAEDIKNQRVAIEKLVQAKYGFEPKSLCDKVSKDWEEEWLCDLAGQMRIREKAEQKGQSISEELKKSTDPWLYTEDAVRDLALEKGFSRMELEDMAPEARIPLGAALAAAVESLGIVKYMRIHPQDFEKGMTFQSSNAEGASEECKNKPCMGTVLANVYYNANYYKNSYNVNDLKTRNMRWFTQVGEDMPRKAKFVLPAVAAGLHECGHIYDYVLTIRNANEIDSSIRKIVQNGKSDLKLGLFLGYRRRKMVQYLLARAKQISKRNPTVGLVYEPGRENESLSWYGSSSPHDFFAELTSYVLLTHPSRLNPLGKAMYELINDDARTFDRWLKREIQKENGKEYKEHAEYYQKHNGHEVFPKLKVPAGDLDKELEPFGRKQDKLLDADNDVSEEGLKIAAWRRLKANYNMAITEEDAKKRQENLANCLNLLNVMREKHPEEYLQMVDLKRQLMDANQLNDNDYYLPYGGYLILNINLAESILRVFDNQDPKLLGENNGDLRLKLLKDEIKKDTQTLKEHQARKDKEWQKEDEEHWKEMALWDEWRKELDHWKKLSQNSQHQQRISLRFDTPFETIGPRTTQKRLQKVDLEKRKQNQTKKIADNNAGHKAQQVVPFAGGTPQPRPGTRTYQSK